MMVWLSDLRIGQCSRNSVFGDRESSQLFHRIRIFGIVRCIPVHEFFL